MEQKPIRRNEHILQLSREHHFTLLFSWKLMQGVKNQVDSKRIKGYLDYFWNNDMQPHFRAEEEILFRPAWNAKAEKAAVDHQQIKKQVEKILATNEKEVIYRLITPLANAIIAHVRYEERNLFPYLEQVLTGPQLEDIGQQLRKQPVLFDTYEDEFWIVKK